MRRLQAVETEGKLLTQSVRTAPCSAAYPSFGRVQCDRQLPCNVCTRHRRPCSYPAPKPRQALVKDAVQLALNQFADPIGRRRRSECDTVRLRQLLAQHAPGIDPDADPVPTQPPPSAQPGTGHSQLQLAIPDQFSPPPQHQQPPPIPATSPSTSSHSLTTASQHFPPAPSRPMPSAFSAAVPYVQHGTSSEALERQPRDAGGYDWYEGRVGNGRATEGTASLSIEPDGQG